MATSPSPNLLQQIKPQEAAEAIHHFQRNPNDFFRRVLGRDPWGKQQEINDAVAHSNKIAIRSCHSSGKTWDVAGLACWFITCFPGAVAITTAPTFRQVEQLIWREIRKAHASAIIPLGGTMLTTRWDIDIDWFAVGVSTDEPENFQGFHGKNVLILVDEASGVPDFIFEAIDGILAGGNTKLVLTGNPTRIAGRFAAAFKDPSFMHMHISGFDTPNVKAGKVLIPGLMNPEYPAQMAANYGENSDIYRVKVLGEFPRSESNTLVTLDQLEQAFSRVVPDPAKDVLCEKCDTAYLLDKGDEHCPKCESTDRRPANPKIMGVDVARFGDDETKFVIRQGNLVSPKIVTLRKQDTMEIAGRVRALAREEGIEAHNVNVDVIGVGGGVVDRLHEMEFYVNGVNVADKPNDEDAYINKRAEGYWLVRKAIDQLQLPKDDEFYQLTTMQYKFPGGKLQMESKEDMKKRGLKSPDLGDALMLTFVPRPPSAGLYV